MNGNTAFTLIVLIALMPVIITATLTSFQDKDCECRSDEEIRQLIQEVIKMNLNNNTQNIIKK